MTRNGVVNLDDLIDGKLAVILDGEQVPVKPIDGVGFQLLAQLKDIDRDEAIQVMYRIAGRCLPTVPEERVLSMTSDQVGAVAKLASEGAEKVEATASPNSGPAGVKRSKAKLKVG